MKNSIVKNIDCMVGMAEYPDKYFDLAVVDPPYGIERFKKVTNKPTIKDVHAKRFQRMESVNNEKPSNVYWKELFRISKNQIIWGANNFELPPSEYFLCWNKEQAMPNFATLEYAWVSMGLKKPAKLFTYSIHKHNQIDKVHPTQKPVPLYDWIYLNYLPKGGKVIDTHLGSGSNRIAADKAGNIDFVGYELDKDYFEAQEKRWAEYKMQQRLF
jgi:site-specific DNA-methyltransferase (adenine-specific)